MKMGSKRKIYLVFAIILVLALATGYLYLTNKGSFSQTPSETGSTQTTSENEAMTANSANLSILPVTQAVSVGDSFTLTVTADTGSNQVAGMDLDIRFDPTAFTVDSITPGSGIANFDQEIINNIDNEEGTVKYSAATLDLDNAVQGSSLEVLTINATAENASVNPVVFSFGPNTVVGDVNAEGLHLNFNPATVNFVE